MISTVVKSVRITNEDLDILEKNNIKFNQKFVHQCVIQFVTNKNKPEKEVLSVEIEKKDEIPSFLFTNTATNDELYAYLKKKPEACRFIYKKYKNNQNFIKELCDPENPIYLKRVAENLQDIYQYQETLKEYEKTKEDIAYNKDEIEKLKIEIQEKLDEYDVIENRLNQIKMEEDKLNREKGNIRFDPGLEKIKSTLDSVLKLTDSILTIYKEKFKENPIEVNTLGIKINKDTINSIELLNRITNETLLYIQDNDFLSPENLDEYRKKLLEQINNEKESAKNEIDSLMEYNPKKVLLKVIQNVDLVNRKIDNATDDGNNGRYLNKITVNFIENMHNESLDYLNRIVDQMENKDRREEKEKEKNGIFHKSKN